MARFGAPHGVGGALRLKIFSRDAAFFAGLEKWWCRPPAGDWRLLAVSDVHSRGEWWYARLHGVDSREAAQAWVNGEAAVERARLPAAAAGDFYWCDLIGLRVLNAEGADLGRIKEVMDIGAHDILRVVADDGAERLIPFAANYIVSDAPEAGVLRVNWRAEW